MVVAEEDTSVFAAADSDIDSTPLLDLLQSYASISDKCLYDHPLGEGVSVTVYNFVC